MKKILELTKNTEFRKWLYGVLIAVLVVLGGEGIVSAAQQQNLGALAAAVLQTAPAAGFALAIRKVEPAATDEA